MTELKPYREYKDSGVEWLGGVPAEWSVEPLGKLFTERRETVSDADYPALSVTREGVVPQLENVAKTSDGEGRKLVRAGDIAINSRSDRKGSSGLVDRDGSVSVITTVVTARGLDPKFAHFLLRSFPFQEEFYRYGSGIVADLWSTRWSAMKAIRLPLPSHTEQQAIAAYLDRETAEIDAFIADQEELIRLLTERRAATISHAVSTTSEVANSKLLPLRRIVTYLDQGWSPNCEPTSAEGNGWGVLKVGCVNGGTFLPYENKALPPEENPRPEFSVRGGDILVSRGNTRELVGSAALVDRDYPQLLLSDLLYRMRVDTSRASAPYVVLALGSREARGQIEASSKGTSASMQKISQTDLRELRLWFPSLELQRQIATRVAAETAELDAAIADAREAISLSRERRAALISAAVTGKIDVREHAHSGVG
ncbi:hypothetical protein [Cryobacterium sp. BB736]|uniref:restriction endonuclease subunit S n=1 Tax=Cryobacterium sp. BB736 TaxID=2746963 RepID=UPI001873EB00|nr:hypothetical protein [Cryobacterium sp. BB736]